MYFPRFAFAICVVTFAPSGYTQVSTPAPFLNAAPVELEGDAGAPVVDNQTAQAPGKQPAPELSKPLTDLSLTVTAYQLEGLDPRYEKPVQALLQAYTGPDRSFEDLSSAAQIVTAFLQSEAGLYLAYAYLPAQEIKGGLVSIHVLPGVLEAVEVNWPVKPLRVDRDVVQSHLNRLKPGSVIRVSEVERVVFLLNDLRGIRMSFAIKPGTQPGQAILVATPSNDKAMTGNIGVDANGSRFAGTYRGFAAMSWESPLGLGDSLAVSHLRSETGGLDFTLLGYTLPVGSNGLKLGANISSVNYTLSENDFPLGLNGEAESLGVFALYPVVRSRNLNLFALLGYDKKEFIDRQSVARLEAVKKLDSYRVSVSGDARDSALGGGLNFFSLSLEESEATYPAGVPFGLDDDIKATRVNYSLGRLQSVVPGKFMLWGSARGQHALGNLDSSEQCSLGGATAVRAFAQGETSGDSCDLFTIELRYLPSASWLGSTAREWSVNFFYDQGRVRFRKDPSTRPADFENHAELAGYGIALAWERQNAFTFNLSLGWELAGSRRSDPKPQSPRIFASYVYYF